MMEEVSLFFSCEGPPNQAMSLPLCSSQFTYRFQLNCLSSSFSRVGSGSTMNACRGVEMEHIALFLFYMIEWSTMLRR